MTTATPTTPKEFEEYLGSFDTPEKMHAALRDGSFSAAIKAYKNAENKTMDALKAEVIEQTQASVLEMFKRNGVDGDQVSNRVDLVNKARSTGVSNKALFNDRAPGAPLNGLYGNMGEFFQAALADPRRIQGDAAERYQKLVNLSEAVPSEGGFLVPEEFRSDIFSVALESAVVRPRANVIPMGSLKLKYPAIDFTTEVGEVYGGMVFYWMDEGETIPDTNAAFAALELVAHKLAGAAVVPNELLRDAPALTTWLRTNLPKGIAQFEDIGFLKGNGVAKPLGALHPNNPALITVGAESGQTSGITWNNILAMFSRMLPESYDNAVWIITPDAIPEIFSMALPVGTGGSAVMLAEGGGSERPRMTLLGRPIIWSRKAPGTLNTQGDISLVDLSTYLIGDRQDVRVDTSEHAQFLADKTVFRVIERVDGQPQLLSALTPENGGPTLSSYVQLATRS